jgi:HTH-like domain
MTCKANSRFRSDGLSRAAAPEVLLVRPLVPIAAGCSVQAHPGDRRDPRPFSYRRIHVLLRREGWAVNHKRVYRLYVPEGLRIRNKRPTRKVAAKVRSDRRSPSAPNEVWRWTSCPTSSSRPAKSGS